MGGASIRRIGWAYHLLVTNFQANATEQGRKFEDAVETTLEITGAIIIERRWKDPDTKEEVDFVAKTKGGVLFWVEAKGSWKSKKDDNGLKRSDTTKKAVANAWHFNHVHGDDRPPYILVTTDLPKPSGVSALEIEHALEAGLFTAVVDFDDLRAQVKALDEQERVTGDLFNATS